MHLKNDLHSYSPSVKPLQDERVKHNPLRDRRMARIPNVLHCYNGITLRYLQNSATCYQTNLYFSNVTLPTLLVPRADSFGTVLPCVVFVLCLCCGCGSGRIYLRVFCVATCPVEAVYVRCSFERTLFSLSHSNSSVART